MTRGQAGGQRRRPLSRRRGVRRAAPRGARAPRAACRRRADRRRQHAPRASPRPRWRGGAGSSRRPASAPPTTPATPAPRGAAATGCCSSTPTASRCPDLLDRYFAEPIGRALRRRRRRRSSGRPSRTRCSPATPAIATSSTRPRACTARPAAAAATGNLLVRRAAFDELGGFAEGIRSAGDVDFCWRMQRGGLDARAAPGGPGRAPPPRGPALVPGDDCPLRRRFALAQRAPPGVAPRWPLVHGLVGTAWDIGGHLAHGRFEPAAFRAIDGLGLVAHNVGYRASNEV